MKRNVEMVMENKEIGAWSIKCKDCPLLPHLKALKQKEKCCVAGLITNVQGPVPLARCEHFGGDDTLKDDPLSLECKYTEE